MSLQPSSRYKKQNKALSLPDFTAAEHNEGKAAHQPQKSSVLRLREEARKHRETPDSPRPSDLFQLKPLINSNFGFEAVQLTSEQINKLSTARKLPMLNSKELKLEDL